MWWKISGTVLAAFWVLGGCDKSDNSSAPTTITAVPAPPLKPRPSTQQLESGPRMNLNLKFDPLSLMVPMGWEVKSYNLGDGPQIVLEGPTVSDETRFRLPAARSITADQELLLEVKANESLTKHPELLGTSVVRDIGGAKVIEQLVIDQLQPTAEDLHSGNPAASQPIESALWTFTVCVPSGKSFTAYDLTVGLTLKQYKADNKFVRSIMDTLKYEAAMPDATIH